MPKAGRNSSGQFTRTNFASPLGQWADFYPLLAETKFERKTGGWFYLGMWSSIKRWVVASLVLAVTLALLHGRTVGYLCDCGDVAKLVAVPDCHQLECHPDRSHFDGCTQDKEHTSSGHADHAHNHSAVKAQVEWQSHGHHWSALPALAIHATPAFPLVWTTAPSEAVVLAPSPPAHSPPPPRQTYLTSLLLI